MDVQEYIDKMKKIQEVLLEYLDKDDDEEEHFENLLDLITSQSILANRQELKTILYLINKISKNHHRYHHFFKKVEKIILTFKADIKKNFANSEVFKLFKSNKKLLLFLVKEEIMTLDKTIILKMIQGKMKMRKYLEYFRPEIKTLIDDEIKEKYRKNKLNDNYDFIEELNKELPEDFEENRNLGENEDKLCKIIRNDLIEEFITYVNKESYSLDSYIKESNFETNSFLLKSRQIPLIEYAAFFGSIQIFKYLFMNDAKLTNLLWLYAIHGDDEEMIHLLEEKSVKPPEGTYEKCIKESIKCHHNHIVNYIKQNLMKDESEDINFEKNFDKNIVKYSFQYYNFLYFPKDKKDIYFFCYACQYDYYQIVEYLMNGGQIDINKKIIQL